MVSIVETTLDCHLTNVFLETPLPQPRLVMERFREYEQICTDIDNQVDAQEEGLAEITRGRSKRNDKFVAKGAAVRDYAMNRQS